MIIETIIQSIGWIGLGLLLFSYILLSFERTEQFFIPVDTIASALLCIHAIIIWDIPFMIVNGFIAGTLAIKWVKREFYIK